MNKPYEIYFRGAIEIDGGTIQATTHDGVVIFFRTCHCGVPIATTIEFSMQGKLCAECYPFYFAAKGRENNRKWVANHREKRRKYVREYVAMLRESRKEAKRILSEAQVA